MLRKSSFKRTILLVCATFLTSAPLGGALVAHAYVSPGAPGGFVNDFANILAPQERSALEAKLAAFERSSSNEIAVVMIPSLEGDTIENFAVELFEEWKIGKEKNDNGVLLLIARDDREVRIEVGYGLEGALTDAQSYWIIQNQTIPAFREGNYYAGINATLDSMIAATQGEYVPSADESRELPFDFETLAFFIFFVPIWLASILGRSKSWWAGGVVGGIAGIIIGVIWGFLFLGLAAFIIFIPLGLLFDFVVSRAYAKSRALGIRPPWWIGGGGRGGFGGGGFGGFGGGSSGGGGASGKW